VAYGTLAVIAALGVIATLDLLDVVDWLPWMGDRPWWLELVGGLAAAVVIPLLLGLAWGRFAVAGAITGIALAVLLHVTAVLAVLTLLYQAAERLARRTPVAAAVAGGVVLLSCAVLTALLAASS
jgi:Na+(H+)/acetate symporter ActP